ncbi:MAG: sel1 repeat family protein [Deltaproteobacteria bacterium]|jgi:TPR repeat protein|nr:sel1 repeat family protein [Deltaproteobacteria bacterium]
MTLSEEIRALLVKAEEGDPEAQFEVANAFFYGKGAELNPEEGQKWGQKAAENGHVLAQFELGHALVREATREFVEIFPRYLNNFGKGLHRPHIAPIFIPLDPLSDDDIKAAKMLDAKARKHIINSMIPHPKYQRAHKTLWEGIHWLEESAEQDYGPAQYELGELYQTNCPFPLDGKKSIKYLELAIEKGHAVAMRILARIYYIGIMGVVQPNKAKCAALLKEAARLGDPVSQNDLGMMLFHGDGVEEDKEEAVLLWENAVSKDFHCAIQNLSVCLYLGNGVEMDRERAIALCRKIADHSATAAKILEKMLAGSNELCISDITLQ